MRFAFFQPDVAHASTANALVGTWKQDRGDSTVAPITLEATFMEPSFVRVLSYLNGSLAETGTGTFRACRGQALDILIVIHTVEDRPRHPPILCFARLLEGGRMEFDYNSTVVVLSKVKDG
jgi:hypothetical protein